MSVRDLLDSMDSGEIGEWMAFEKAFGPLGNEWRDETLAAIHDQLQALNHMFTLANFDADPDDPIRIKRSYELLDEED